MVSRTRLPLIAASAVLCGCAGSGRFDRLGAPEVQIQERALAARVAGSQVPAGLRAASAGVKEIRLDAGTGLFEVGGRVQVTVIRVARDRGQAGILHFRCRLTDSLGRTLDDRIVPLAFGHRDTAAASLTLHIAEPVAIRHRLVVTLLDASGRETPHRAAVDMHLLPRPLAWDDYLAFHWKQTTRKQAATLKRLGISGGAAYRINEEHADTAGTRAAPYYVSNMADFIFAPYQAAPEKTLKPVLDRAAAAGEAAQLWIRTPSLSDPAVTVALQETVRDHLRRHAPASPRFYELGAHVSTGLLTAANDFCGAPHTLEHFRLWLKRTQYPSLRDLNAQWGTSFAAWNEVRPDTIARALARTVDVPMPVPTLGLPDGPPAKAPATVTAGNWSSWSDFKAFLDNELVERLQEARRSLRRVDPTARAGITGALLPSAHGGYDYGRLLAHLDVIGISDLGVNLELARSFAPGKPILTTHVFDPAIAQDPAALGRARHALWRAALHGGRGAILWDQDGNRYADATGQPTALGEALAPTLRELSGGIVKLIANAQAERPVIALHYSQASIRAHWMRQVDTDLGGDWLKRWGRDAAAERRESDHLRLLESWTKLIEDANHPYTFISARQIAAGELIRQGFRVLVLPQSIVIGDEEAAAIRAFHKAGGRLLQDGFAGVMDGHGRPRRRGVLDDLFGLRDRLFEIHAERPARVLRLSPLERQVRHIAPVGLPALTSRLRSYKQLSQYDAGVFVQGTPEGAGLIEHPFDLDDPADVPQALTLNVDLKDYLKWRLEGNSRKAAEMRRRLAMFVNGPHWRHPEDERIENAGVETHVYDLPSVRTVALHRNRQTRWHELGGPPSGAQPALEKTIRVHPLLGAKRHVYDVRTGRYLGRTERSGRLELELRPYEPRILALFERKPKPTRLRATGSISAGQVIRFEDFAWEDRGRVVHYRLTRPDGAVAHRGEGNVFARFGVARAQLPTAINDPVGTWTLTVRDVTTGETNTAFIRVGDPLGRNTHLRRKDTRTFRR